MRKTLSLFLIFAMSTSLFAANGTAGRTKGESIVKKAPKRVYNQARTESFTIQMEDAYGDGWNGAGLELFVNGVSVLVSTGPATGSLSETFNVEDFDYINTLWTTGAWDGECYYYIIDPEGFVVAEAGTNEMPDLTLTHTVDVSGVNVFPNSGFEGDLAEWSLFPGSNMAIESTGAGIYNSEETFTAYAGSKSFKMWSQGANSENNVFQAYEGEDVPPAGTVIDLSGMLYSHTDDFIGQGTGHGKIVAKYFGFGPNGDGGNWWETFIRMDESRYLDASSTPSTWENYALNTVVPEGVFHMELGFTLTQPEEAGGGSIYADNIIAVDATPPPAEAPTGVFFSEYAEGTSNNKYLEIFNGTADALDLTGFAFPSVGNAPDVPGMYEYWNVFPEGASVAAGDVYVIAHGSADAAILAEADHTHNYLSNGDDGYCLAIGSEDNYAIVDCIGDFEADPGSGWAVAGVENATQDHTLTRNPGLMMGNMGDWAMSAGTDAETSEWTVLANEDWSGLGSHNNDLPCDLTEYTITVSGDFYPSEINWNVIDADGNELLSGGSPIGVDDAVMACLADGEYTLNMIDLYGDGWNGDFFTMWTVDADGVYTAAFTATLNSGASGTATFVVGEDTNIYGCMDQTALNYNADATSDDGSCVYAGDLCSTALTYDGSLDGSAPLVGATTSAGDANWYAITVAGSFENLMVSLMGSSFDTKLELWAACTDESYLLYNDDANGTVQSEVLLVDPVVDGMYYAKVYGYGSGFGEFTLNVEGYDNPVGPTGLTAVGGIERVYLDWEAVVLPARSGVPNLNEMDQQAQEDEYYASKKASYEQENQSSLDLPYYYKMNPDYVPTSRTAVTIELYGGTWNSEITFSINDALTGTEVVNANLADLENSTPMDPISIDLAEGEYILTANDAYGDGWNGSYIYVNGSDGTTFLEWTLAAGETGQQSFVVGSAVAELSLTNLVYDNSTDLVSVDVTNSGGIYAWNINLGYYLNIAANADCYDETNNNSALSFALAQVAPGVTETFSLAGLQGFLGFGTHDVGIMADYFCTVPESDETNNLLTGTIDIVDPFAGVTFSVYRGDTPDVFTLIASALTEVGYVDDAVTADVEYCYQVTQSNDGVETPASNTACATPVMAPIVPGPTDLTGTVNGFDVSLAWTAPAPLNTPITPLLGTPSNTRQGGEDIATATVITELPATLTGSTVGYADDYDCDDIGTSTAGDVVYSITPASSITVDLTTCFSAYDTKLFVFKNDETLFATDADGNEACNDDGETGEGCTQYTSRITLNLESGNTYYVVVDGWGGSEGDYALDILTADPLQGYNVYMDGMLAGSAPNDAVNWDGTIYAAQPTDASFTVAAVWQLPDFIENIESELAGPVVLNLALDDTPGDLVAEDHGDEVHLMWEPPMDASMIEIGYDDGLAFSAWWYEGAVATRFRVSGTYGIDAIANMVWTGGWPDATLGVQPFTLSILASDPQTGLPGETLFAQAVTVDADPSSDSYGWAMIDLDETLVVTNDVYVMYSDFGFDEINQTAGPDMDMMALDAELNYPSNKYELLGPAADAEWALSVETGNVAGGDWILRMHTDFTVDPNGVVAAGDWLDVAGNSATVPNSYTGLAEAANTKENPATLLQPSSSDPIWTNQPSDRDMMGYNIYRDEVMIDDVSPDQHDYVDGSLDWGTYMYQVAANYGDHESMTNMVEITLSNVAPNAVNIVAPADNLTINVNEGNMSDTEAFIWTAASDEDNDPISYYLYSQAAIEGDSVDLLIPGNTLMNGSFEENHAADGNDWQVLPDHWLGYPSMDAMTVVMDGYDGEYALKLWGLGTGENTENNVFQEWSTDMLPVGTEFNVSAELMSLSEQYIGDGNSHVILFAKYFGEGYSWIGMETSAPFNTETTSADEWYTWDVDCVVPEGAAIVQVGAMFFQPTPEDLGSVFIDDFYMEIPLTTTGVFVQYGHLAQAAIAAGVNSITWDWDVWSFDGYEETPSAGGPRTVTVDISELLALDNVALPNEFALHNNYPNPFNPVTNILYDIPEVTDVKLEIFNVMGQRVRTLAEGSHEAGRYQIVWNATNDYGESLSSGMYIYRIQAGDFVSVKKLILMK